MQGKQLERRWQRVEEARRWQREQRRMRRGLLEDQQLHRARQQALWWRVQEAQLVRQLRRRQKQRGRQVRMRTTWQRQQGCRRGQWCQSVEGQCQMRLTQHRMRR